jgi:hypothetical protein
MIGGFGGAIEITQDHKDLVSHNVAAINAKTGAHATSYTINSVHSQVVAGTNYFFHLTDNTGHKYSVFVHVPLPHTHAPAEFKWAEAGHTHARHPF